MSRPKELYMRAINGEITFYDEKPKGNCVTWVEKSAYLKAINALRHTSQFNCYCQTGLICIACGTLDDLEELRETDK